MKESWINKCVCGNFIPDDYVLCDSCLLKKYGLLTKGRDDGYGNYAYEEEDVVDALRIAEKGGYVKND